jgi:membrane-bound lytic murein transglycosylase D
MAMNSEKLLLWIAVLFSFLFLNTHEALAENSYFQKLFGIQTPSAAEAACQGKPGCTAGKAADCPDVKVVKSASRPGDEDDAEDAEDEKDSEQDIMETSLSLLEDSQELWVKGDVEGAIRLLDQAYELMLKTDGDPDIARQKDDLRLLISKRILTIYTSQQTKTNGKYSEIPLIMNADVEKEIRLFQTVERDFFISSYQRSGLYRPMIVAELKKAGLPEELSWLPLVESGFKICALSRARALGLWQFIPSTGYKYGMNRDEWIDERMDSEKSTVGAIGYLKELHQMFGDWLTVLAAYNCGEGRVLKVIAGQHINYLDRFWDLYRRLPYETARYVPRFLATLHIIRNPKKYGMNLGQTLENDSPFPYSVVKTSRSMRLSDIAAKMEISEDALNVLNAELRLRVTPDRDYNLKVPADSSVKLLAVMDEIPQWEKPAPPPPPKIVPKKSVLVKHKVKKGQTLSSIAQKYGTTINAIREANRLSKRAVLKYGQILTIPSDDVSPVKMAKGKGKKSGNISKAKGKKKFAQDKNVRRYKVKRGDTLVSLAKRFDVSVQDLKKMNNLSGSSLKAGETIKVIQ